MKILIIAWKKTDNTTKEGTELLNFDTTIEFDSLTLELTEIPRRNK